MHMIVAPAATVSAAAEHCRQQHSDCRAACPWQAQYFPAATRECTVHICLAPALQPEPVQHVHMDWAAIQMISAVLVCCCHVYTGLGA